MKCKLCNNNIGTRTSDIAKKWQICKSCYVDITEHKIRTTRIKHTNCIICGTTINSDRKVPTCTFGNCRGKYYRMLSTKQSILKAIETKNNSTIRNLRVSDLELHGYTINIIPHMKIPLENIEN